MERTDNEKSSGTSSGVVGAVGAVCAVVGAVIGAVGVHYWQKQENKQHCYSRPEKIYNRSGNCPICLEGMHELTVLPCGHQYHAPCANQLKSAQGKPTCPICRAPVSD